MFPLAGKGSQMHAALRTGIPLSGSDIYLFFSQVFNAFVCIDTVKALSCPADNEERQKQERNSGLLNRTLTTRVKYIQI